MTKMVKIYLDMDGVVSNFMKEYSAYSQGDMSDRQKFRDAVLYHHIFEKLEKMTNADLLLHKVSTYNPRYVQVEMLTSLGTFRTKQGREAKRQKVAWLEKHGIHHKPNFTHNKLEKGQYYGNPNSILIDDSIDCITSFIHAGGLGILHIDADIVKTLDTLDIYVAQLMGVGTYV